MSKTRKRNTTIRKKTTKKKINKSKAIIFLVLLLVSIFSLSYATKNIVDSIYSVAITKEKDSENNKKEKEEKKQEKQEKQEQNKEDETQNQEIEQLTLEKEPPKKKKKIMIDPGHGGDDKGNTGFSNESFEKDISLQIGKKVASKLAQYEDIEVILTRSEDVNLPVKNRVEMANSQNVDILVSIHQNAEFKGNTANGTETYYQTNSVDNSSKLAKSIQDTVCLFLETRNRGVLATNQEILRDSMMASAVIEVGFITNKEEEKQLKSTAYQEKMAEGIAQGILSYIDSTK